MFLLSIQSFAVGSLMFVLVVVVKRPGISAPNFSILFTVAMSRTKVCTSIFGNLRELDEYVGRRMYLISRKTLFTPKRFQNRLEMHATFDMFSHYTSLWARGYTRYLRVSNIEDATEVSRSCLTKQVWWLGVDCSGSAISNHICTWLDLASNLFLTPRHLEC